MLQCKYLFTPHFGPEHNAPVLTPAAATEWHKSLTHRYLAVFTSSSFCVVSLLPTALFIIVAMDSLILSIKRFHCIPSPVLMYTVTNGHEGHVSNRESPLDPWPAVAETVFLPEDQTWRELHFPFVGFYTCQWPRDPQLHGHCIQTVHFTSKSIVLKKNHDRVKSSSAYSRGVFRSISFLFFFYWNISFAQSWGSTNRSHWD